MRVEVRRDPEAIGQAYTRSMALAYFLELSPSGVLFTRSSSSA